MVGVILQFERKAKVKREIRTKIPNKYMLLYIIIFSDTLLFIVWKANNFTQLWSVHKTIAGGDRRKVSTTAYSD